MADPPITVLISAYNEEQRISGALECILAQTCADFELLVIDDASRDRTAEVICSFPDPRIRLLRNAANLGLTSSLNRGIAAARGAFIARLDADDRARPERLAKQLSFLQAHPDIAVLGSGCQYLDASGTVVGSMQPPVQEVEIKWRLLFYNCLPHSSVMFRKKEIAAIGGYTEAIKYAQDYDLWLRAAQRYHMGALAEELLLYRLPATGSVSRTFTAEQTAAASQIRRTNFLKLGIAADRFPEDIDELTEFLFYGGLLRDARTAALLCTAIIDAFAASSFCSGIPRQEVLAIRKALALKLARQYQQRAWTCYHQDDLGGFRRHLRQAMRHVPVQESLPLARLYLKSLLGKKFSDALHQYRKHYR